MAVKTLEQLERNVAMSFSYVKKDMLMLNDALSDIHDKIQHLSLNHAELLAAIQNLSVKKESTVVKKKVAKKENTSKYEELDFYDVKAKKSFTTNVYKIKERNGRRFAVAVSPEGTESWRVLGNSAKKKKAVKKAAKKATAKKKTSTSKSKTVKKAVKKKADKKTDVKPKTSTKKTVKKVTPKKVVTETETITY